MSSVNTNVYYNPNLDIINPSENVLDLGITRSTGLYFLLDCSTLSSIFSLGLVSFKFTSPCVEYVTKNIITK